MAWLQATLMCWAVRLHGGLGAVKVSGLGGGWGLRLRTLPHPYCSLHRGFSCVMGGLGGCPVGQGQGNWYRIFGGSPLQHRP